MRASRPSSSMPRALAIVADERTRTSDELKKGPWWRRGTEWVVRLESPMAVVLRGARHSDSFVSVVGGSACRASRRSLADDGARGRARVARISLRLRNRSLLQCAARGAKGTVGLGVARALILVG